MIIHVGDTLPALSDTITHQGEVFDLTGSTVTLSLRMKGGTKAITGEAQIASPATGGAVAYAWAADDTDSPGVFYGAWEVDTGSGTFTVPGVDVVVYDPAAWWASIADVEAIAGQQGPAAMEKVIGSLVQAQQAIKDWVTREIPVPVPARVRRAHALLAARALVAEPPSAGSTQPVVQESIGDYSVRFARPTDSTAVLDPSMHADIVRLLKPWAPTNYNSDISGEVEAEARSVATGRIPASSVDYSETQTVGQALDDLYANGGGDPGPGPGGPVAAADVTVAAIAELPGVTDAQTALAEIAGTTAQAIADAVQFFDSQSSLLSGTGDPGSGLGENGDFYVRTDGAGAPKLFGPKTSGAWGAGTSLLGAAGAPGAAGDGVISVDWAIKRQATGGTVPAVEADPVSDLAAWEAAGGPAFWSLSDGDRVALDDRIDPAQTGVYVYEAGVSFARATDADTTAKLHNHVVVGKTNRYHTDGDPAPAPPGYLTLMAVFIANNPAAAIGTATFTAHWFVDTLQFQKVLDFLVGHIFTGTYKHAAADITYAGSTNLSATTVEGALDELDAEKADASATTTALAGKASTSAVSTLDTRVGTAETNITANTTAITQKPTVMVWDGTHYVATTGRRIFVGPGDPASDGFTVVNGDLWEQTT